MVNIISWIVFGLIAGAIAKLLMPGRDPGGFIVTTLLGIAGSVVGGYLYTLFAGVQPMDGQVYYGGWILSIVGAMLLLFMYRLVVRPRPVV